MSWLRACAATLRRLPRRGIEEFWQGGVRDPKLNAAQKQDFAKSGDPWPAVLLRQKSFEDMHKLWYVLLKEKNFLLAEQHEARQQRIRWKHHGRLKKVKLSMKRILTVLTRREIHQQVLRAKEMLVQQTRREELETQRFQLEESMKVLSHKIRRAEPRDSIATAAWKATLQKYEADHQQLLKELVPLRRDTMQLLSADWRYAQKYSDLPGAINWKRQWVRALEDRQWKPVRLGFFWFGWDMNNGTSSRADKDSWEDKIQRIAAESKARSEAGEAILGNTFGSKARSSRSSPSQVEPNEAAQDFQRGMDLAEEAMLMEAMEEASDQGSSEGNDDWSDHSAELEELQLHEDPSAPLPGTKEIAETLEQLIMTGAGFAQSHKQAMEQLLLQVHVANFWIQVVKHVPSRARRQLAESRQGSTMTPHSTSAMLRLLHGRMTLFEALSALGPSWSLVAEWIKCAAQRRLNELCSAKNEACQLENAAYLLRSGASLLSTDGRGRLPAHLCANTGTSTSLELLVRLLQLAPATLLMEDDEGSTPLDLLARAPLFEVSAAESDQALVLTNLSTASSALGLLSQLSDAVADSDLMSSSRMVGNSE
eukprot:symbB.v1.2.032786.t1/scaffold3970.1/size47191/1